MDTSNLNADNISQFRINSGFIPEFSDNNLPHICSNLVLQRDKGGGPIFRENS